MRCFFSVFILLFIVSCGTYKDNGIRVTGKFSEILIVCDEDVWNDKDIRNSLDTAFVRYLMPYFPDVQTFELKHLKHKNFSGLITRHRNLVLIKKAASIEDGIQVKRITDVWANGQKVFEIEYSNKNRLIQFLKGKTAQDMHDEFAKREWERELSKNTENKNQFISKKLKEYFKIDLELPEGSGIVTTRKNFFRIEFPPSTRPMDFVNVKKSDIGLIQQGVLVYQYDYKDDSQFSLDSLLKSRDTLLRYNVPHEIDGLYMGTQYSDINYPEMSNESNFNGKINGKEIRGMYAFIGHDFPKLGGAFWGFHFLHPKTKKIICISGYLDAPPTVRWTHFLREIQAVWKSVELNE